jgi:hypothetical protein
MGIDATEIYLLSLSGAGIAEDFTGKNAIVGVISSYGAIKAGGVEFEVMFGLDGFQSSGRYVRGKIEVVTSVVYKKGTSVI